MPKKKLDVIVLGNFVADLITGPIDVKKEMPEKGDLKVMDKMTFHLGGAGCITSIALAKLGVRTGVIGKLGNDALGRLIKSELEKFGIDTKGIIFDSGANTSTTMALVDRRGERTFLHSPGSNAKISFKDVMKLLNYIRDARHLHVGHFGLLTTLEPNMAKLFQKIKQKTKTAISLDVVGHLDMLQKIKKKTDVTISLDTGGSQKKLGFKKIKPCLKYVDIFIPSLEEARTLTGIKTISQIIKTFLSAGNIKIIGIKMGKRGCFLKSGEEECFIPAFRVKAVDTLGAGDSFYAGFLAAWLKGWNLYKCGRFANAVGAHCVSAAGGTQGIKTFKETLKFVQKHDKSKSI